MQAGLVPCLPARKTQGVVRNKIIYCIYSHIYERILAQLKPDTYVPPECAARMPLFLAIFLSVATYKMAIYSQYALQILKLAK